MKIRKIVIPAAGLGTRFYPLTKAQPKEMLPIFDKPIIHYIVEEAIESGLDEILIIIGKGKEAIVNYFDRSPLDNYQSSKDTKFFKDLPEIFYVRQKEQKGLADAIGYAKKFVGDEPFVVALGDTFYTTDSKKRVTKQIIDEFGRLDKSIIAVEEVEKDKIKDYGIIAGQRIKDNLWIVKNAIEKPEPKIAPSNMGITGLYVFTPEIFNYIKKIKPGRNNEYQLTDAINLLCKKDRVYGFRFEGERYDIGTKELWIKTFIKFSKGI